MQNSRILISIILIVAIFAGCTKINNSNDPLKLSMPINGNITQNFTETHQGIDFVPASTTPPNTNVLAAQIGTVESVTNDEKYGNSIIIDHENGYKTLYSHLNSTIVNSGEKVTEGQTIGTAGNSGETHGDSTTLLHFELQIDNKPVDPSLYFSKK